MDQFQVESQALEEFASTATNRSQAFDTLRSQMTAMELPADAFGHVPGIGTMVYLAYEDYVHNTTDSLAASAESMAQIAAAVRGVVQAYQDTDQAPQTAYDRFQSDLGSINMQGLS